MAPDGRALRLDDDYAEALDLVGERHSPRELALAVAHVAKLERHCELRVPTLGVLADLALRVQEACWDGRVMVRPRSEVVAKEVELPDDLAGVAAVALDLGLGRHHCREAPLAEVLGSLRSPLRRRLQALAETLLRRCVAEGVVAER